MEVQASASTSIASKFLLPSSASETLRTADQFFERHVVVSAERAQEIGYSTRQQSLSAEWHSARRVRVTSTIVKSVANRRKHDFTAVVRSKLQSQQFRSSAKQYALRNESTARSEYVETGRDSNNGLSREEVGFVVNPDTTWLGASPD